MAFTRIRNLRPVKRHHSERFLLISLVTFALTVVAVRGVLKLTGYAQIGSDTVHIAHVLWGGLGLFAAALVLLVFANRWALVLGAVLGGGGMGLFIDEVGKFVTQSNDYFTPAAAPIIYALFLAIVLVYLRVRRPPARDPRGEMYRAFEQMPGVLDHEMSRHDLTALAHRLEQVQISVRDESVRKLAAAMLALVETEVTSATEPRPGRVQRVLSRTRTWGSRVFTRPRLQAFIVLALFVGGGYAVLDIALLAFLAFAPSSAATEFLGTMVPSGELAALGDKVWFSVRAILEGSVGLTMLAGSLLIVFRRERKGLSVAVAGLIVDLTAVNLLVFYQDQFKALIGTALEYIVLAAAFSYRRIYLEGEDDISTVEIPEELRDAVMESQTQTLAPGTS